MKKNYNFLSNKILYLAKILMRPPEETQTLGNKELIVTKKILLFVIFIVLFLFFFPYFVNEYRSLNNLQNEINISMKDIRILYEDSPVECDLVVKKQSECLANPYNSKLWNSEFRRSSEDHFELTKNRKGKTFWLGLILKKENFKKIIEKKANHLVVGYFNAKSKIWINGKEFFQSSKRELNFVNIPYNFFINSDSDLKIAVEVNHIYETIFPDILSIGMFDIGFKTTEQLNNLLKYEVFLFRINSLILFSILIFIFFLFSFFWSAAKRKQEYYYVALFVLFNAFIKILSTDFVTYQMDSTLICSLIFIFYFYLGSFGMFLGLAFARIKRLFFIYGVPLVLACPFFIVFNARDNHQILFLTQIVIQYIVPIMYLLGAIVCFLQAFLLRSKNKKNVFNKIRLLRLYIFSLLLFFLALLFYLNGYLVPSTTDYFWYDIFQVVLIIFMSFIVLSEYRDQEARIEKFNWSKHFNRELMPVEGTFVRLDIKNSELIPSNYDDNSSYSMVFSEIRLRLTDVINESQGSIIFSEGDEIIAVFDKEESLNSEIIAFKALNKICQKLINVQSKLLQDNKIKNKMFFRASLVNGKIMPYIEKTSLGVQLPKWKEVEGDPLVNSKRIMDIEKEFNFNNNDVVIIDNLISLVLEKEKIVNEKEWYIRLKEIKLNQKNKKYICSVFLLR